MRDLPSGTVTFCFTDVEGSTRLLEELGAERYAHALAEHRRALRSAFSLHGGVEVDTQGDAFFYAFPTAPGALQAAAEATEALAGGRVRVRVGIHTGTPLVTEEGYVGRDVHKAARIAASGHGGQVLVSSATAALVQAEGLRDLGEHRLKDLSVPERIYQAGEGDFPPLKTLYRTNLPVPATPFLGRAHELAEVEALLAREDVRLLTLIGPGGTGKTRLALQAAAEASDRYPDGVFWAALAALRDPALVLEQAAQAVGAKDGLAEHVADKRLLLLLDNFEHLIEAADELPLILASCPRLELLVTSRELLALPGEQAYPVPPLEPEDGTELFVARARAAKPDFSPDESVPELCRRLDQLPLALELAAARVRMLSPGQLLGRLSGRLDLLKAGRGVDPRQQTLRATIEWSHDLLSPEEQRLFARLAVFRGGCTLEAAEAVCDADLDTLQSLLDKSLLRLPDEERFWMLETIRGYATERLEASGEKDELRRRHAEFFLALAEEAEQWLSGPAQASWLERVDVERDNVRAALTLAVETDTDLALRSAAALRHYWIRKSRSSEGRRWLAEAIDRDDAERSPSFVRALCICAELSLYDDDLDDAERLGRRALAEARRHGDHVLEALCLSNLGTAAWARGNLPAATDLYEQAVNASDLVEQDYLRYWSRHLLGEACRDSGEHARALDLLEESAHLSRAAGDGEVTARTLHSLADLHLDRGEVSRARPLYVEALALMQEAGQELGVAYCLAGLACVLGGTTAATLWGAVEAIQERLGATFFAPEQTRYEHLLGLACEGFPEALKAGRRLATDEAVELALAQSP